MRPIFTCAAMGVLLMSAPALGAPGHGGGGGGGAMPMASTHSNAAPTSPTPRAMKNNHTTGQPSQSCGSASAPETPGNAASAPGSAFNPDGNAGTHYAGQQPQNSNNPKSVAQYDAACSHQK